MKDPIRLRKCASLVMALCVFGAAGAEAAREPALAGRRRLDLYDRYPVFTYSQSDAAPSTENRPSQLALNIEDLGFEAGASKGDPRLQRKLNRRSKMLRIHQLLGLATGVAMAGALATAGGAKGGPESRSARSNHAAWGYATGALYAATASFAIFAPEVPGEKKTGRTKIHQWLAFIHFPAMVATIYYGQKAKDDLDNGRSDSTPKIAAATTLAVSYYTAMAVMVVPFGGNE